MAGQANDKVCTSNAPFCATKPQALESPTFITATKKDWKKLPDFCLSISRWPRSCGVLKQATTRLPPLGAHSAALSGLPEGKSTQSAPATMC